MFIGAQTYRSRLGRGGAGRAAILAACCLQLSGPPAHAQTPSPSVSTPPPGARDQLLRLDARIRAEVAENFARILSETYARVPEAERLAQTIRARLTSGAYDRIVSPLELARTLQADARTAVEDNHLRVTFNSQPPSAPPATANPADQGRRQNGAISKLEILPGNVGYMQVNGVPPVDGARDAVVAAFAFLRNTDALIIDVRANGGGDPRTVALYMSYLSEGAPYVVNTVHWRDQRGVQSFSTTDLGEATYGRQRPVYVLTSRGTFSGGESLAYDIQAFKRGVVVGQRTGGGANPGRMQPLGHGFVGFIPAGFAVHPVTGSNWEGKGVIPDVEVRSDRALSTAHGLAVAKLLERKSDTPGREPLEATALKLKVDEGAPPKGLPHAELAGAYAVPGSASSALILVKGGQLLHQAAGIGEDIPLTRIGPNRYRSALNPSASELTFVRTPTGIELLMERPGSLTRLRKVR